MQPQFYLHWIVSSTNVCVVVYKPCACQRCSRASSIFVWISSTHMSTRDLSRPTAVAQEVGQEIEGGEQLHCRANLSLVSELRQHFQYHVPTDAFLLCLVLCAEAQRTHPQEQHESPQPIRIRPQAPAFAACRKSSSSQVTSASSPSCGGPLSEASILHSKASGFLEVLVGSSV